MWLLLLLYWRRKFGDEEKDDAEEGEEGEEGEEETVSKRVGFQDRM